MHFWDWKTGYNFQRMQTAVQPGSIDSEAGVFAMTFDHSNTRLITAEADKTIKIYKEDDTAVSVLILYAFLSLVTEFFIYFFLVLGDRCIVQTQRLTVIYICLLLALYRVINLTKSIFFIFFKYQN